MVEMKLNQRGRKGGNGVLTELSLELSEAVLSLRPSEVTTSFGASLLRLKLDISLHIAQTSQSPLSFISHPLPQSPLPPPPEPEPDDCLGAQTRSSCQKSRKGDGFFSP